MSYNDARPTTIGIPLYWTIMSSILKVGGYNTLTVLYLGYLSKLTTSVIYSYLNENGRIWVYIDLAIIQWDRYVDGWSIERVIIIQVVR